MKKIILTTIFALFVLPLAAVTVKLTAVPAQPVAGEHFILNISVNTDKEPAFSMPQLPPGLTVSRQISNRSSSVNIINGSRTVSTVYGLNAVIDKPGKITIPPFSVKIDGKTYSTNALTVTALDPAKLPPDTTYYATLTIKPSRKLYTGESVQTDIELFIPDENQQLAAMPQFVFENFGDPLAVSRDRNGNSFTLSQQPARRGKGYTVVFSAMFQLRQSGTYDPLCRITLQSGRNSFWGVSSVTKRTVTAKAAAPLQVLPLPPLPAGAVNTGLSGKWQISAALSKTTLPAGEMGEVILKFSGDTPALNFKAPQLKMQGVRPYPPEIEKNDAQTAFTVKYPFVALQPGKALLQETLAVFDPQTGKYVSHPVSLTYDITPAAPGTIAPAPAPTPANDQPVNNIEPPVPSADVTAAETPGSSRKFPLIPVIIMLAGAIAGIAGILLIRRKTPAKVKLYENLQQLAKDAAHRGSDALDRRARLLIARAMKLTDGADFCDIAAKIQDQELAEFFHKLGSCDFIPGAVPPQPDRELRSKIEKFIKSLAADLKKA